MEDHGQQGARHGGVALGPATAVLTGRPLSLAPSQAGPAAVAGDTDVTGQAAATAAAHHRR